MNKNKIMLGTAPICFTSKCTIVTEQHDDKWQESARSWEVSCEAIAPAPADDPIKRLLDQEPTFDVTIERPIGKLPRKMKKAFNHTPFNKNTKWMRKLLCYMERRAITVRRCTVDMHPTADGIEATFVSQDETKRPL